MMVRVVGGEGSWKAGGKSGNLLISGWKALNVHGDGAGSESLQDMQRLCLKL